MRVSRSEAAVLKWRVLWLAAGDVSGGRAVGVQDDGDWAAELWMAWEMGASLDCMCTNEVLGRG